MKVTELLEEVGSHGDEFLPFGHYYGDCTIFESVYAHWHKEMEFIYIRKGSGLFRINKEVLIGHKGDLVIVEKEVIHHIKSNKKDILHFESIVFDVGILQGTKEDLCQIKLINPLMKKQVKIKPVVRMGDEDYPSVLSVFFSILKVYMEKPPYYFVALKGLLFQLFYELMRGHYIQITEREDTRQIEAIKTSLNYIDAHYGEPITAGQLAEKVHYSEYHFMKLFKEYMGKTLNTYINEYRIERSKYDLLSTEQSIEEIAEQSGFCSASYFIQRFQKHCDITPQKFRKLKRENERYHKNENI